jgi:hypothetical protein
MIVKGDDALAIQCNVADLVVAKGIATPRVFVVDTRDSTGLDRRLVSFADRGPSTCVRSSRRRTSVADRHARQFMSGARSPILPWSVEPAIWREGRCGGSAGADHSRSPR